MHRWKQSALAAAVLAATSLYHANALALALGPLSVQSALGEPLRAEISLPQITTDEASTLRVNLANPEVFRRHGFDYGGAAANIQVQLHQRPDGTRVLRLRSDRPLNDPFIDVVIDASWSAGQLTRSYTLLLDPPVAPRPAPAVAVPAQIPVRSATPAVNAASPAAPVPAPVRAMPPAAPTTSDSPEQIVVRPGEIASRIAERIRPESVSLDQMLVALLRNNPKAFIQENVNRLRAGAVLKVPTEEQAQSTTPAEARRIINAQARNFNDFRRQLAASARAVEQEVSSRSASGSVQSAVEEARPLSQAPDRLTLSKGALNTEQAPQEQAVAVQRQSEATQSRAQELSRNMQELQALSSAATASAGAPVSTAPATAPETPAAIPSLEISATAPAAIAEVSTGAAPAAPAEPTPVTVQPGAPTPALTAEAETATAAAPQEVAEAPAAPPAPTAQTESAPAPAKPKPKFVPPPPPPEESLLDSLLADPLIPMAGGGILVLLLGYLAYNAMRRRKAAQAGAADSTFLDESRLQPDSFFGSSGGQRVDTSDSDQSTGAASSMMYSPSQLDAGGDVDPVAEADVYLAYGRDLQAEEILKEALRLYPDRVAIHSKLCDIYAKRQDRRALEQMVLSIKDITGGSGADWEHALELGRRIDPDNELYRSNGMSAGSAAASAATLGGFGAALAAQQSQDDEPPLSFDLDTNPAPLTSASEEVDLDLSLDDALMTAPAPATASTTETAQDEGLDFSPSELRPAATPPAPAPTLAPTLDDTALNFDPVSFEPPAAAAVTPATMTVQDSGLGGLDFEIPTGFDTPPTLDSTSSVTASTTDAQAMDFALDLPALDTGTTDQPAATPEADIGDSGLMDFDLSEISLDLPASSAPSPVPAAAPVPEIDLSSPAAFAPEPAPAPALDGSEDDTLVTKLALAEEFHAIGDTDGARALIEEVVAEADGALRLRAQRMLNELDA